MANSVFTRIGVFFRRAFSRVGSLFTRRSSRPATRQASSFQFSQAARDAIQRILVILGLRVDSRAVPPAKREEAEATKPILVGTPVAAPLAIPTPPPGAPAIPTPPPSPAVPAAAAVAAQEADVQAAAPGAPAIPTPPPSPAVPAGEGDAAVAAQGVAEATAPVIPTSPTVPAGVGAVAVAAHGAAGGQVVPVTPDSANAALLMILNLFKQLQLVAQPQRVIYRGIEFSRINIAGDGNCLFTAIGRAIGNSSAQVVRDAACVALQGQIVTYLMDMQEPMVDHRRQVLLAKQRLDHAEKQYLASIVSLALEARATMSELADLEIDARRASVFRDIMLRAPVDSRNKCIELYEAYVAAKEQFERSIPDGCKFDPAVFDDGLHVEIPGYRDTEAKIGGKLEFQDAGIVGDCHSTARTRYYSCYIEKMREDKVFGTDLEAKVLAQVYSRPVVILTTNGLVVIHGEGQGGVPIFLEHSFNHYNLLEAGTTEQAARDALAQLRAQPTWQQHRP
ncbi:MAG: hypothetical protein KBD64_05430 [Gammaproteobacteria bacterium]|nr:hypothetical protein [Gammaproteobacteria bacterium]